MGRRAPHPGLAAASESMVASRGQWRPPSCGDQVGRRTTRSSAQAAFGSGAHIGTAMRCATSHVLTLARSAQGVRGSGLCAAAAAKLPKHPSRPAHQSAARSVSTSIRFPLWRVGMAGSDSSGPDESEPGGRSSSGVRVAETDLAILTAFCGPYLDGDRQFAVPAPHNEILRELAQNGIYLDLDTLRGHLRKSVREVRRRGRAQPSSEAGPTRPARA